MSPVKFWVLWTLSPVQNPLFWYFVLQTFFSAFSLCELCTMVKQWRVLGFRGRWQADYGVEASCVSMFFPSRLCVLFRVGYYVSPLSVSSLCWTCVNSLPGLVPEEHRVAAIGVWVSSVSWAGVSVYLFSREAEAFAFVLEESFLMRFEELSEMLPLFAVCRTVTFYWSWKYFL